VYKYDEEWRVWSLLSELHVNIVPANVNIEWNCINGRVSLFEADFID
jgi:hypothetical protein